MANIWQKITCPGLYRKHQVLLNENEILRQQLENQIEITREHMNEWRRAYGHAKSLQAEIDRLRRNIVKLCSKLEEGPE